MTFALWPGDWRFGKYHVYDNSETGACYRGYWLCMGPIAIWREA